VENWRLAKGVTYRAKLRASTEQAKKKKKRFDEDPSVKSQKEGARGESATVGRKEMGISPSRLSIYRLRSIIRGKCKRKKARRKGAS